jgi:hypothetical protein
VLLLFLGRGWEVLLWPMNEFFFGIPVLAMIIALLLLDREDLPGDVGAGIAVAAALASSGVGIPVAAGVVVEVAWTRWRRLWVVAVPLGLWGLWALTIKGSDPLVAATVGIPGADPNDVTGGAGPAPPVVTVLARLPRFVGHEAAAAFGGIAGVRPAIGVAVGAVALLLFARKLVRDRGPSPRLLALGTMAIVFWVLTGLTRAQFAGPASRYTYVGSVILLLLAVEAVREVRFRPALTGVLAVGTAAAVVFGLQQLAFQGDVLRDRSAVVRTRLAAIEREAATVDPATRPDPVDIPGVTAGAYLATVDALGSPVTGRGPSG